MNTTEQAKNDRQGAQAGYRRLRLVDAARALPLLGLFLWAVPLLWGPMTASLALIYIFAVWGLLILGAFILTRRLTDEESAAEEPGDADTPP